jgi:MCP family monocarboxylic acid transporter-like MFS transporter 10
VYIVLTYIDLGAVQAGISPDFSFYLISIANVSSAPGRILTGIVADRVGEPPRINFWALKALIIRPRQHHRTHVLYASHDDIRMALRGD